jgi:hypothetical protein
MKIHEKIHIGIVLFRLRRVRDTIYLSFSPGQKAPALRVCLLSDGVLVNLEPTYKRTYRRIHSSLINLEPTYNMYRIVVSIV